MQSHPIIIGDDEDKYDYSARLLLSGSLDTSLKPSGLGEEL